MQPSTMPHAASFPPGRQAIASDLRSERKVVFEYEHGHRCTGYDYDYDYEHEHEHRNAEYEQEQEREYR